MAKSEFNLTDIRVEVKNAIAGLVYDLQMGTYNISEVKIIFEAIEAGLRILNIKMLDYKELVQDRSK